MEKQRCPHCKKTLRVLTPREEEVAALLVKGLNTRECANRLGLSVKTVQSHHLHLKAKLRVTSSRQLLIALLCRPPEDTDQGEPA